MDKEKKLYCRLASEFTIEELEAKIGKIDNEYESKFFEKIKESINRVGPSDFINSIRSLNIHETSDGAILDAIDSHSDYLAEMLFEYVDCSIDGFTDIEVFNIIIGYYRLIEHYRSAHALHDAYINIMHKTISGVIRLGYIRVELGALIKGDNSIFSPFGNYGHFAWEHWDHNDGYETYDVSTVEFRYQKIMDFMKTRLTMLQYDVFEYWFNNGLLLDRCRFEEACEDEKRLFREVREVFEENADKLFKILVS